MTPAASTPTTPAYVVVLGAANLDVGASAARPLLAGDSTPGRVSYASGGVARNVAENLARLSVPVHLFAPVGDDFAGRGLLTATRACGVAVDRCWVLPGVSSSSYVSLHTADGESVAAINDMAILERVGPELLAPHRDLLRSASAVLVDCNLPAPALEWVFAHVGELPVFVEPVSTFKCLRVLPWLGRVHTIKLNRLEAEALWGRPLTDDADVEAAAAWLLAQGVRQAVLSLGARGAYGCSHADRSGMWQPAIPAHVVNATGAGDALMAGLLRGHLLGQALPEALRFGSACAALTLGAPGANHAELSVQRVLQCLDALR